MFFVKRLHIRSNEMRPYAHKFWVALCTVFTSAKNCQHAAHFMHYVCCLSILLSKPDHPYQIVNYGRYMPHARWSTNQLNHLVDKSAVWHRGPIKVGLVWCEKERNINSTLLCIMLTKEHCPTACVLYTYRFKFRFAFRK